MAGTMKPRKTMRTGKGRSGKERIAATLAAIDEIEPAGEGAAKAIALLKSWLKDESGYDEETWPQLKKNLERERRRSGARRLFDG